MDGQIKTSFRFSWNKPCKRIFVSGTFNNFQLDMLSGDSEKFLNAMVQPGRIYYRFKVDGIYQVDITKPTTTYEKALYNYADIEAPKFKINSKLKEVLESPERNSKISTCKSSTLNSLNPSPFRVRPLSLFRNMIALKSIIKIQAWIRSVFERMRYKRYLKHLDIWKNRNNVSIETVRESNEGYEKLKKKIEILTEENKQLKRDYRLYQIQTQTCKPALKKLDIYKTTRNFKTGSFLRVNTRDGGRLTNSVSPLKSKIY